ncbi:polymer-forming cytoskeletal protein [Flavimarina sp. Hel_I_48]|uniref:bactofilin family protein n=1 Tax=Flavimarina sp. Hel_I_48 TaxID=1392488 RepID=UPI000ACC8901|nr:polymer-forming cytoskeletal protein [Flavimarina sp. Hel_I_48]
MKWEETLNRYFNTTDDENQLPESTTDITEKEPTRKVKKKAMNRSSTLGIDPNNNQNRISQGTKIVGDITSSGSFRVDGEFEGTIKSSGKVVIGETGTLKGTLHSSEVEVEGKIEGKIVVSELLSLRSTARVQGEVITSKLAVEPGATFNASCDMNSNANRAIKTLDGREKTEQPA